MLVIPAIDLKAGQCVRLLKGDFDTAHVVASSATQAAREFLAAGATLIHMVDLDGAKDGVRHNYKIISKVIEETGARVEVGGGIRNMSAVRYALNCGVSRVVIGSAAVDDPAFAAQAIDTYGDKIVIGIDARGGTVRTGGWLEDSGRDYLDFARKMAALGPGAIIFTDIERDGALTGPALSALEELRRTVTCELIASGGVSSLADIEALKQLGVDGAITGKAVYAGRLDLAAAIREAK